MPSRDSERWTLGSVVFNACAASVVEIVLSISLSIVPLDCARWAALKRRLQRSQEVCRLHRVTSCQKENVGEVTLPGRRCSPVDHRDQFLGHHSRNRVAQKVKGAIEKSRILELHRTRGHRISDAHVDTKNCPRLANAGRCRQAHPGVELPIPDHTSAQLVSFVAHASSTAISRTAHTSRTRCPRRSPPVRGENPSDHVTLRGCTHE